MDIDVLRRDIEWIKTLMESISKDNKEAHTSIMTQLKEVCDIQITHGKGIATASNNDKWLWRVVSVIVLGLIGLLMGVLL